MRETFSSISVRIDWRRWTGRYEKVSRIACYTYLYIGDDQLPKDNRRFYCVRIFRTDYTINSSFYSQGIEQTFVIGPEEYDPDNLYALPVIDWFYGLELWECEEPETGEEEDIYSFVPDKYPGFAYVDKGNKAFLVVNEK